MNNQDVIIHFSERERMDLTGMSKWFKGMGFAILIMGLVAIILPHMATLAVQILIGIVLLVAGIVYLTHALQVRKWRNMTLEILTAALFLLMGVLFLAYPFGGALALTILLGFFFIIHGSFKIPLALAWRHRPGWGWILTSGIISIALGIIVILGLPGSAVWLIGLLLGIDLIFTGATSMAVGAKLKSVTR